MIYNGLVHIPKEVKTFCPVPEILGICIPGRKTMTLEEQNFDSWISGGAKLSFTLTENDVYGDSNNLILYMLEMPFPENWDMLENYRAPETYEQGMIFMIKPRLE